MRHLRTLRWSGASAMAWVALVSLPGCSGPTEKAGLRHPLEASPLGPTLSRMWAAHGGLERWSRLGRVEATVSVEGDPSYLPLPDRRVAFDPHELDAVEVNGVARDLAVAPPRQSEAAVEDFQARSARTLFHLPFLLSEEEWSFRIDVEAHRDAVRPILQFWAIPSGKAAPYEAIYIIVDPATFRVARAFYQVKHPHHDRRIFEVTFSEYERVDGLIVPRVSTHRGLGRPTGVPAPTGGRIADPFESVRGTGNPQRALGELDPALGHDASWRMVFSDIAFEERAPAEAPPDGARESDASATDEEASRSDGELSPVGDTAGAGRRP